LNLKNKNSKWKTAILVNFRTILSGHLIKHLFDVQQPNFKTEI